MIECLFTIIGSGRNATVDPNPTADIDVRPGSPIIAVDTPTMKFKWAERISMFFDPTPNRYPNGKVRRIPKDYWYARLVPGYFTQEAWNALEAAWSQGLKDRYIAAEEMTFVGGIDVREQFFDEEIETHGAGYREILGKDARGDVDRIDTFTWGEMERIEFYPSRVHGVTMDDLGSMISVVRYIDPLNPSKTVQRIDNFVDFTSFMSPESSGEILDPTKLVEPRRNHSIDLSIYANDLTKSEPLTKAESLG